MLSREFKDWHLQWGDRFKQITWQRQFCQKVDLISGQNIKNPKLKILFFSSELREVDVRNCVQLNFPIINLILLTAFHKFARSRGQNTSAITNCQAAFLIGSMNDCHRDIITRLVGLVS